MGPEDTRVTPHTYHCGKSEIGSEEGRETDCFVKAASAMCPTVKYCAWGPVL